MKKSVMQVLMIAVLVAGMVIALVLININTQNDERVYIPEHSSDSVDVDNSIVLDGYSKLDVCDCDIPLTVEKNIC